MAGWLGSKLSLRQTLKTAVRPVDDVRLSVGPMLSCTLDKAVYLYACHAFEDKVKIRFVISQIHRSTTDDSTRFNVRRHFK